MTDDELKPCPFCGVDEPDLWDDNGGDTSWYHVKRELEDWQQERWRLTPGILASPDRSRLNEPLDRRTHRQDGT